MAAAITREKVVDALGLVAITLALLDVLHPALLLLPTIAAGGDTPCHYPTAAWLAERLLPAGRLHGWYPGAYLGQPILLYYFPFAFVLMALVTPVVGLPVAFKLGTALGVFALPILVYVSFRVLRLPFPTPVLGAAAALVFLFVEDNPIWGGTLASTLAGEFAYTYGLGLAVLFLAVAFRAHERGAGPWGPAALLALTAYAHGYAVLWAGLSSGILLVLSPRPWPTLRWLGKVGVLAFAFAAPFLVPLLGDWGFTTPYDDPWITVSTTGLFPPLLWPLFAAAVVGLGLALARPRGRSLLPRLLLLAHAALTGAALAVAAPAFGVIDVRLVPFAQLSLALTGAAALGVGISRLARRDLVGFGLVLLAIVHADASSRVLRSWADWNYTGLEAKELWPAWERLADHLRGGPGDPRVAVEYSPVHERAGSIRMYETLPFFSGRSTLEGVYNQASVMTHPVYYLASELFARSPNPFRRRTYSRFDPASGLSRLRLLNVSQIVALSDELQAALDARPDVVREARIPPYTVYRLSDPGPGYAEPLAFEPVRASVDGWRDNAYRWMTRKPANRAHLVFTSDERFSLRQRDPWAPPPERALPSDVRVESEVRAEEIRIRTSRPGHPVLVKLSYHPRWRATGADGPFLASPGLMIVVPRAREVVLRYAARTGSDALGALLFAAAAAGGARVWWRRRSGATPPPSADPSPPRVAALEASAARRRGARALRAVPLVALAALGATRLLPAPRPSVSVDELDGRASRAFADERWEDAAEYERHAIARLEPADPREGGLLCVRGEALLKAGHPREAAQAFESVVQLGPDTPHLAQALYSGARAREAAGDATGAGEWRRRLEIELPLTPWAERQAEEARQPPSTAR